MKKLAAVLALAMAAPADAHGVFHIANGLCFVTETSITCVYIPHMPVMRPHPGH